MRSLAYDLYIGCDYFFSIVIYILILFLLLFVSEYYFIRADREIFKVFINILRKNPTFFVEQDHRLLC